MGQPGSNLAGEEYAWNRVFLAGAGGQFGRWSTPDPAACPWENLFDYVWLSPITRADRTGCQSAVPNPTPVPSGPRPEFKPVRSETPVDEFFDPTIEGTTGCSVDFTANCLPCTRTETETFPIPGKDEPGSPSNPGGYDPADPSGGRGCGLGVMYVQVPAFELILVRVWVFTPTKIARKFLATGYHDAHGRYKPGGMVTPGPNRLAHTRAHEKEHERQCMDLAKSLEGDMMGCFNSGCTLESQGDCDNLYRKCRAKFQGMVKKLWAEIYGSRPPAGVGMDYAHEEPQMKKWMDENPAPRWDE